MNFFFLPGPQFLGFYLIFFIFLCVITPVLVYLSERKFFHPVPLNPDFDPNFIAWLKNKESGVLSVAVGSLIEKSLIEINANGTLQRTPIKREAAGSLSHLDKRLLNHFSSDKNSASAIPMLKALGSQYRKQAVKERLILTRVEILMRRRIGLLGAWILFGLGFCKIIIALGHGHHNILLLLLGMLIAVPLYSSIFCPKKSEVILSARGKDYLERIGKLLKSSENPKLKWLVLTLAGTAVLPAAAFAGQTHEGSSSGGSSCSGSSCSGSSCGGSGCGGCGGD